MSATGARRRDEALAAHRPTTSDVTRKIGEAWAAVDAIRVEYGPQADAAEGLLQALHCASAKAEGAACGAVTLIAPRGTGKSATIGLVAAAAGGNASEGSPRALHVSMDTAGTVESVPSAILAALGDARPDLGNPRLRWLKATSRLREAGVRLILLDEFNRASRRPTVSSAIGQAICEKIMDAGVAAVAFVGDADASLALKRAPLLLERVDEELDLSPLLWVRPGDDELWTDFVARFDEAMQSRGLVSAPVGFASPDLAELMCDASSGIVRRFVKIVRLALADAMRRGDRMITRADLRAATGAYALPRGFLDANPFDRSGS